jgi:hypothetical protein
VHFSSAAHPEHLIFLDLIIIIISGEALTVEKFETTTTLHDVTTQKTSTLNMDVVNRSSRKTDANADTSMKQS